MGIPRTDFIFPTLIPLENRRWRAERYPLMEFPYRSLQPDDRVNGFLLLFYMPPNSLLLPLTALAGREVSLWGIFAVLHLQQQHKLLAIIFFNSWKCRHRLMNDKNTRTIKTRSCRLQNHVNTRLYIVFMYALLSMWVPDWSQVVHVQFPQILWLKM